MKMAKESRPISERAIINTMKRVLIMNNIPPAYYHIGGYAEECVCLERVGDTWEVYVGERGNRNDSQKYLRLKSACLKVFEKLAVDDQQCRKMQHSFQRTMRANTYSGSTKTIGEASKLRAIKQGHYMVKAARSSKRIIKKKN